MKANNQVSTRTEDTGISAGPVGSLRGNNLELYPVEYTRKLIKENTVFLGHLNKTLLWKFE